MTAFHMITMRFPKTGPLPERERKFAFESRADLDEFRKAAREMGWQTHRMTPAEGVSTTSTESALAEIAEAHAVDTA